MPTNRAKASPRAKPLETRYLFYYVPERGEYVPERGEYVPERGEGCFRIEQGPRTTP